MQWADSQEQYQNALNSLEPFIISAFKYLLKERKILRIAQLKNSHIEFGVKP